MLESEKEPFSWGFEAGFLRSPVNPRMLLLNRTPEIDCADDGNATGNASAWSLVSIANDLLRVDLSWLFNEIGGHFRERAKLRFYIDLQNAIRTKSKSKSTFKNKRNAISISLLRYSIKPLRAMRTERYLAWPDISLKVSAGSVS